EPGDARTIVVRITIPVFLGIAEVEHADGHVQRMRCGRDPGEPRAIEEVDEHRPDALLFEHTPHVEVLVRIVQVTRQPLPPKAALERGEAAMDVDAVAKVQALERLELLGVAMRGQGRTRLRRSFLAPRGEERLGVREREEERAVDPMDADDVRVVVGQPRELRTRPSYKEVRLIGAHADVAPTEAGDRGVEGEQALLVAGEILLVLARLRDTAAFRRGIVFDRAEEQAAQRRWQDFGAVPDVRESLLYFRVDARGRRLRVEVDGGAARRTTKVGCAPDQRDE